MIVLAEQAGAELAIGVTGCGAMAEKVGDGTMRPISPGPSAKTVLRAVSLRSCGTCSDGQRGGCAVDSARGRRGRRQWVASTA